MLTGRMKSKYEQPPNDLNMKSNRCCGNSRGPTLSRRCIEVAEWILPSAILALIPKCPICLAAYIALWTGLGLSVGAAANLRVLLIVACVISLVFLVARQT